MKRLLVVSVVAALATAPLQAQLPGISVYAFGGGYSAAKNVLDAPVVDFRTGYTLGFGLAVDASRVFTLRGEFAFANTNGTDPRSVLPNLEGDYNRFLYAADVKAKLPWDPLVPYVFGGIGGITIDPELTNPSPIDIRYFSRVAGRFGAGFDFWLSDSKLAIFAQGTGWVYTFDAINVDATQLDVTYTMGLSYRLSGR